MWLILVTKGTWSSPKECFLQSIGWDRQRFLFMDFIHLTKRYISLDFFQKRLVQHHLYLFEDLVKSRNECYYYSSSYFIFINLHFL